MTARAHLPHKHWLRSVFKQTTNADVSMVRKSCVFSLFKCTIFVILYNLCIVCSAACKQRIILIEGTAPVYHDHVQ